MTLLTCEAVELEILVCLSTGSLDSCVLLASHGLGIETKGLCILTLCLRSEFLSDDESFLVLFLISNGEKYRRQKQESVNIEVGEAQLIQ